MSKFPPPDPDLVAVAFWDRVYQDAGSSTELDEDAKAALRDALAFFGPVNGKTIVDIGCGNGATSLFFACMGARVVAVDTSQVAITKLKSLCREHGIENVTPVVCNALDIDGLGRFDHAFGLMVLHHIEPFEAFGRSLANALVPGGKAFFFENNAASNLLMWFRRHVVGKLWIPKYGDPAEFPFMPREIETLRRHFSVEVEYPRMLFFQLASSYLLKGYLWPTCKAIDDFLYSRRVGLRYSYHQNLLIRN